jgi:hypothetical protein
MDDAFRLQSTTAPTKSVKNMLAPCCQQCKYSPFRHETQVLISVDTKEQASIPLVETENGSSKNESNKLINEKSLAKPATTMARPLSPLSELLAKVPEL